MLRIQTENIGDLALVECEGRLVNRNAALRLRNAVTSQTEAKVVVLALTEVWALDRGGLGMLVFLRRWAHDHDLQLKIFNPSSSVRHRLQHARTPYDFEIASLHEMTELLTCAEEQHADASSEAASQRSAPAWFGLRPVA